MDLSNTTNRLMTQLEEMLTQDPPADIKKMPPDNAYKRGIEDSLALVRNHCELHKIDTAAGDVPLSPSMEEKPPQLSQLPPARVAQMGLSDPEKIAASGFSRADLIEAAFYFENRLLELLADDNTIPFDAYETLDSRQLGSIIQNCADKIIRLQPDV